MKTGALDQFMLLEAINLPIIALSKAWTSQYV